MECWDRESDGEACVKKGGGEKPPQWPTVAGVWRVSWEGGRAREQKEPSLRPAEVPRRELGERRGIPVTPSAEREAGGSPRGVEDVPGPQRFHVRAVSYP